MSSGFITESEAVDVRKRRQEEWERVRKAEDPLERPEEAYDNRSLFEKLQEQKQKKDLEYEEAHKLKNMIKGLDDDEIEFLDLVDRTKLAADRKKELEEEKELNDYRNRVAILQEKSIDERLQAEIIVNKPKVLLNNRTSQQKLLKGAVIKKRKMSDETEANEAKQVKTEVVNEKGDAKKAVADKPEVYAPSALKPVAILPGLGHYEDSTSGDEDNSSDSDVEPKKNVDFLGRNVCKVNKAANS
ncbi:unnamed protein product [Brassicogethes aeneus]|uniref:FAM192A/Fyv6 N-terminal domain-containing protein n=1 Tax=Brassicogethes aeneus TaxID=1431903 RepID=A0A9P0AZF9_BRAAE|nr:unnamed protein product [Brassicogethes aeneus]